MSKVSSNRISNALTSVKSAPVNLHPTTFAPSRLLRLSVTLLKSLLVKDASDRSQPANEAKAARHDRHVERSSFAPCKSASRRSHFSNDHCDSSRPERSTRTDRKNTRLNSSN